MRLTDALGTTVLSRDDAEELGRVRHLVVDVGSRRISAVHIDGRRKKALLVDWDALSGFGPDAVVVGPGDALRGPADDTELAMVAGDLDWIGRRVLTDQGNDVGSVTDIEFDPASGALTAVVTEQGAHDAERLRALGPYCVVVRA
ncbi:MAG: PRC-barrel domain-containing protein [Egibacteraceae bacterium]